MYRLIFLLLLVLYVVVIVDIIRSNKDTEKKILWILVVFFMPVLGSVLYYVIGRK